MILNRPKRVTPNDSRGSRLISKVKARPLRGCFAFQVHHDLQGRLAGKEKMKETEGSRRIRRIREAKTQRQRDYLIYLESGHWKNLRGMKIKECPRCLGCQSPKRLHVHHIHYRNLTDCTLNDLAVLCEDCHRWLHIGLRVKRIQTHECPAEDIQRLIFVGKSNGSPRLKKKKPKIKKHLRKAFRKELNRFYLGGISVQGLSEFISNLMILRAEFQSNDIEKTILNFNASDNFPQNQGESQHSERDATLAAKTLRLA